MSRYSYRTAGLLNTVMVLALLSGAAVLRFYPDFFDHPIAQIINRIATTLGFANKLALALTYPAVQGVIMTSLIWYSWFSGVNREMRARIISGVVAAVFAAVLAYLMQHILPPTQRPIFDIALENIQPRGAATDLEAAFLARSPSFPSERATMFAGLAVVLFTVRRKLGLLTLGFTGSVELCRIHLNLHYPTDIIGSFALGASVVYLGQVVFSRGLANCVAKWEETSTSTFYACAFIGSYFVATAFQELRQFASYLLG